MRRRNVRMRCTTDDPSLARARQGRRPVHRPSVAVSRPRFPAPPRPETTPMSPWMFGRRHLIPVRARQLRSVGHLSYVLVDLSSRIAAVIDPPRDIDPCLEIANHYGARLRHVFLTKFHSDFECGHLDLIERAGATVYTGAWGHPDYEHLPLKDGDVLQFGNLSLRVCETPGHVLEGLALVASA